MIYNNLPIDIINTILLYNGTIKLRNGKYMNQIQKNDPRYDLLKKIPEFYSYNGFTYTFCEAQLSKIVSLKKTVSNDDSSITVDYHKEVQEGLMDKTKRLLYRDCDIIYCSVHIGWKVWICMKYLNVQDFGWLFVGICMSLKIISNERMFRFAITMNFCIYLNYCIKYILL
jgi:hypothetical protein